MKSWFIEDPKTKDLVKNITTRIVKQSEVSYIIVMKAPVDRIQYNLTSFISIQLSNPKQSAYKIEKMLRPLGDNLEDIEI